MEKTLVYTFKTFPYINDLNSLYEQIRVFGYLKKDIDAFCKEVGKIKPTRILGFAKSTRKFSTIEKYTVNQFHGKKKIVDSIEQKLELAIPRFNDCFKISKDPTNSFCNYSMFKIQLFLKENRLGIPFFFFHVLEKDLKKIKRLFAVQNNVGNHILNS